MLPSEPMPAKTQHVTGLQADHSNVTVVQAENAYFNKSRG
jgi:hypothetical protein